MTFSQRFLSTPSARRATFDPGAMFRLFRFLSTPSARRATNQSTTALTPLVFLSTPSARRATSVLWAMTNWHRYFYPRPPRGGRRRGNGGTACGSKNFYPRPPRGGRRARWNPLVLIPVFLSTPSARRATAIDVSGQIGRQISIHALREEGDLSASYYYTFSKISIHALREEGDQEQLLAEINRRRFLSTPSARRATARQGQSCGRTQISIHALREEGDQLFARHGHR